MDPNPHEYLTMFSSKKLWCEGAPLRLHLGCGENRLDGYVNIDYPSTEHTVQAKPGADIFTDITKLRFPAGSVDEIRLHHVFEHFNRAHALGLLIRWHEWLKAGGAVAIETPDVMACVRALCKPVDYRSSQALLRHMFGSHEADWAYHLDGWYEEKFADVLGRLGFRVQCQTFQSPHEPFLANVLAVGTKTASLERARLLEEADAILAESTIGDFPTERKMHAVWRDMLRRFLHDIPGDNKEPSSIAGPTNETVVMLFSKDRAMQLDAALRSFHLHCRDSRLADITVLFRASSPLHEEQYRSVARDYAGIRFLREENFHEDVVAALDSYRYVLFLVDDNIFVRDFSLGSIVRVLSEEPAALGFSLRLGRNTTTSYAFSTSQNLPGFEMIEEGILKYRWVTAEFEFGFPLEVSSSVYRIEDILPVLTQQQFRHPNTMEKQMARSTKVFAMSKPFLLCGSLSVTFCNPVNVVQKVHENRVGNDQEFSSDNLSMLFSQGKRISVEPFSDFVPSACHQEVTLSFYGSESLKELPPPVFSRNGKELEQLNSMIAFNPESVEVHSRLADLYLEGGRTDAAITCYRKILTFSPNHSETLEKLVTLYRKLDGLELEPAKDRK